MPSIIKKRLRKRYGAVLGLVFEFRYAKSMDARIDGVSDWWEAGLK